MQYQHVLVFVHDEAGEEVALGIHDAERRRTGHVLRADGERFADALLEEILVHLDAFGREDADADARFGIPIAHAEQSLPVILHLHDAAIGRFAGHAEDAGFVEPRMSGEEAVGLARFDQDGGQ